MEITLLHHTPLFIAAKAIRKCYKSEGLSDTKFYNEGWDSRDDDYFCDEVPIGEHNLVQMGSKDKNLIERIGNQMKHKSTLRHVQYVFECDNISTKTLLAFTRHTQGKDISVESTRFTLSKRADELSVTKTDNEYVNDCLDEIMKMVAYGVEQYPKDNDNISMLLPHAYNYSFITTMNIQSLQHLLSLRTPKTAHWDIRNFAYSLYEKIPPEHKYLFEEYVHES